MSAEPSDAERLRLRLPPAGRPVMRQVWRHLAFLHWPVERAALAPLLPADLDVDTFGGVAWVGIVPFTIPLTHAGFVGAPLAPAFHEINLRTYVHRGGRDPGVWFFSLDATSRLAVAGARLAYGLPYHHARIAMDVAGEPRRIDYRARRRPSSRAPMPAQFECSYGPDGDVFAAAPGTLELFLVERYLLYSRAGGELRAARVAHAPYPVQRAFVGGSGGGEITETLTRAAGVERPAGAPPIAHYASEVDVQIFGPRRLDPSATVR
jgi:hypothetical protein